MAQGIASATNVREVFRALFLFATYVSLADGIFVATYDPERSLRRCVYAGTLTTGGDGQRALEEETDLGMFPMLPLNEGPQSRAIVSGEPVLTPGLDAAVVGFPRVDTGSDFDEHPPRSSLAVPFAHAGAVLGSFEVQSTHLGAFEEAHVPALKMAATLAAIAVRNLFNPEVIRQGAMSDAKRRGAERCAVELELSLRKLTERLNMSRSSVERRFHVPDWPEEMQDLLDREPGFFSRLNEIANLNDAEEQRRVRPAGEAPAGEDGPAGTPEPALQRDQGA